MAMTMKALLLPLALAVLPAVVARADEIADLRAALERVEAKAAAAAEENLRLRADIRQVQQDRDEKLQRNVELVDKNNQLQRKVVALQERLRHVADVLREPEKPSEAPQLDGPKIGVVTAVGKDNLIEVSGGIDDGLREGHVLEIFRGENLIGKAVVRRVTASRCVAQCFPGMYVRKGDTVGRRGATSEGGFEGTGLVPKDDRQRLEQLLNAIERRGEA